MRAGDARVTVDGVPVTAGPGARVAAYASAQAPRRYEPVGTVEIAERLAVTRQAVDKWRERGLGFPAPAGAVGGRPAWDWPDVERWARDTGRLT